MSSDPPHSTAYSGFLQTPPTLQNPFTSDILLQRILQRQLGSSLLARLIPTFTALGNEAISPQIQSYVDDANRNLPQVIHWDGWGKRKDELLTSEGWKKLKGFWARSGMMEDIFSRPYDDKSRIVGFTKYLHYNWDVDERFYLIAASLGGTTCPLAMTDGVARCLELHASKETKRLCLPRLISRVPSELWTSGQWMTERSGGSDISGTETRAYPDDNDTWTIKGFKWFSSATDSDITLLLAKTPKSDKVSLFWARVKNDDGSLNGIRIIRLKDKFGTKTIPTAELELIGMQGAVMIGKEGEGVKVISEVLNITRVHCALGCLTNMRRGFSIVTDYAQKRKVFGRLLSQNPLHLRTLAALAVQLRCMTHLTFLVINLQGKTEFPSTATNIDDTRILFRLLTPILKATVAKTAVSFLSECMECLGGQGYVEEGGIGVLYRDSQVNTIWEGTTNVLADDMLRVLRGKAGPATLNALDRYVANAVQEGEKCAKLGDYPQRFKRIYEKWRGRVTGDKDVVTAHARELILWLGRLIGTMEMMIDAASDGDDIEIECCKRVFDSKNQGWEGDAKTTMEWDRRIVFGDKSVPVVIHAKL